jgi:hypothetical protein
LPHYTEAFLSSSHCDWHGNQNDKTYIDVWIQIITLEVARKLADTIEEAPSIPRGATKQRHSKCTCRKSKPELETGNVLAVSRSSHSGVNKPIDYQRGLFLCAVSYSKATNVMIKSNFFIDHAKLLALASPFRSRSSKESTTTLYNVTRVKHSNN